MNSENKEKNTTPPAPDLNKDAENPTKAPIKRQKKKAIIFASIVLSLLVILPILSIIDFDALFGLGENEKDKDSWIHFYGDQYFGTPNYNEDIEKDEEYMELDRMLYYSTGNETFQIIDDPQEFGSCCVLFYNYFKNLKNGDHLRYYTLFTDRYEEEYGKTNPFTKKELRYTPQKVYNIKVTLLQSTYLENGDANGEYVGSTMHYFNVEYCIKDNNGTYRRDILSDMSRSLVFEVLETDGKPLINDISFYRYVNSDSKN